MSGPEPESTITQEELPVVANAHVNKSPTGAFHSTRGEDRSLRTPSVRLPISSEMYIQAADSSGQT